MNRIRMCSGNGVPPLQVRTTQALTAGRGAGDPRRRWYVVNICTFKEHEHVHSQDLGQATSVVPVCRMARLGVVT